jgi:hypothetical protein
LPFITIKPVIVTGGSGENKNNKNNAPQKCVFKNDAVIHFFGFITLTTSLKYFEVQVVARFQVLVFKLQNTTFSQM